MPPPAAPSSALLIGYPLRLWERQQRHNEALLRELERMLVGHQIEGRSAPGRLVELAHGLVNRYGPLLAGVQRDREQALARGQRTMDLSIPLLPESPRIMQSIRETFDEVDGFCRQGKLLLLPTPPDLVAFRDRTGDEIVAKAAGGDPTPWSGPVD